jgi:eukaryotic-like serine/threonine-protein kinase
VPAVGDVLAARYRIDGVLGAGGMSSVYLATDLRLERQVAVKVLLANLSRDPEIAERFDREARMLAAVAHPSIAEIFDVEQGDPATGREPFYVMELCEGGSLAARIEASGPLEPGELVPLIVIVAAALGELHGRGLLHRDVKPANILFTGGRPKLADFGLARPNGSGLESLTQPGTAMGTPAYMAPELVTGGLATASSDVYALAATTFHGLTGRAPRPGSALTGLAERMVESVPLVSSVSPRLGPGFDHALAAALSNDPSARPSLGAFTSSLVAALGPSSVDPEAVGHVDPTSETTRIAVPEPPTRIARHLPAPESRSARDRPLSNAVPIVLLIVALLAIPTAIAVWPDGRPLPSTPGGAATPTSPASPSPQPTESSAPSPTMFPSAPPTIDPRLAVIEALQRVETAISQAKGGPDGLKGGDAKDLQDLVDSVRSSINANAFEEARSAAEDLLEKARKVAEKVDDERGANLVRSIEAMLAAFPG